MALYALTVQPPSATQQALTGDFVGNNRQQILTANGSRLDILEVSRRQKGFRAIYSQDIFAIIRHVEKFRLAGGTKGEFVQHTFESPSSDFRRDTRDSTSGHERAR